MQKAKGQLDRQSTLTTHKTAPPTHPPTHPPRSTHPPLKKNHTHWPPWQPKPWQNSRYTRCAKARHGIVMPFGADTWTCGVRICTLRRTAPTNFVVQSGMSGCCPRGVHHPQNTADTGRQGRAGPAAFMGPPPPLYAAPSFVTENVRPIDGDHNCGTCRTLRGIRGIRAECN